MSKYNTELDLDTRNSLSLLIKRIQPNSIILEFGPANGRMTKYLKEQLNCRVYAVELDENAAKDVSKYTEKIFVDNIENYNWKKEFEDLKFDFIIFADVLEHLYDPEKVLKSVNTFLADDGSILVSVPNIAHNSIIINLCRDQFIYKDVGLLDNTHIRFFTKITFDELIKKCNYNIKYEDAIFVAPIDTEFCNSYDEKDLMFLKERTYGEAYQFIYELKAENCETDSKFLVLKNYTCFNKNLVQYNKYKSINALKIIIEQKEDYIQEQRKDLDAKRIIIEQKEDYIQEQREELDEYKATKFYKMYKLLKGKKR
jgi:2-polyprenyl-3-methyl-5-hydroxy-6-metoxy-1,4-benzoquinol methylase